MPSGPTPRQQARADNLERIKTLALAQLADAGAAALSLRAIARELHIVSSAIYRYYPGRDELITDLVVDAYGDLADHLQRAGATRRGPRGRWTDTALALRAWAVEQPHRFTLVYGSAIPGYAAPPDTIAPAARVLQAFLDAAGEPGASAAPPSAHPLARRLRAELGAVDEGFGAGRDHETVLAHVRAFAQVIGLLTLELNGHLVGGFEPADLLFAAAVDREADALGL